MPGPESVVLAVFGMTELLVVRACGYRHCLFDAHVWVYTDTSRHAGLIARKHNQSDHMRKISENLRRQRLPCVPHGCVIMTARIAVLTAHSNPHAFAPGNCGHQSLPSVA